MNPDTYAEIATAHVRSGDIELAHLYSVASIKARARLVLVNGKWCQRQGIMRDT